MVNCFVLLLLVTLTTTTTTVFSYTFDPVVSEPNTQFLSNKFNPLSSYLNFRSLERRSRSCPSLKSALPNGWAKLRSSSRIARFNCNNGFFLIGNRYATCIRGRWNRDLPICVSTNCSSNISAERPLIVRKIYQGSVADLHCELGYDLRVNTTNTDTDSAKPYRISSYFSNTLRVYCVRNNWVINDEFSGLESTGIIQQIPLLAVPVCEVYEKPVNISMECDYEESICGWFQDNEDDFDWIRNYLTTPSHLDGTGPSHDHTLGQNHSGHYLYLESSYPRSPNDVARLYSPVYEHVDNESVVCFQFYYHMYGKAIGSLRVYVKEKAQVFGELSPVWEAIGDQGDQWSVGQVEIRPYQLLRPFQIIIEGVVGHGHQGDIAIDDLHLFFGKQCSELNNSTDVTVEVVTDISDTDSAILIANETDSANVTQLPRPQGFVFTTVAPGNTTATAVNKTTTKTSNVNLKFKQFNEVLRSVFKMKSSPTTTTTTSGPSIPLDTNKIAPTNSSTNGTKISESDLWWKTLHNHMNNVIRRNGILVDKLKTFTSTVATTTTNSSALEEASASIQRTEPEVASTSSKSSSSSPVVLLGILFIIALVSTILYLAHTNRVLERYSGANLDQFVATFVSRCKIFHSNSDDGSELLIVNGANGGVANQGQDGEDK